MTFIYEHINTLNTIFASKHCFVTDTIILSKRYLTKFDIPKQDLIDISMVLRELLINALEHGNNRNVEKKIYCTIEFSKEYELRITVRDEGDGFNYRSLNMILPEVPCKNQRRGFPLINSISDRLEFNDKGNCITAYLTVLMEKVES